MGVTRECRTDTNLFSGSSCYKGLSRHNPIQRSDKWMPPYFRRGTCAEGGERGQRCHGWQPAAAVQGRTRPGGGRWGVRERCSGHQPAGPPQCEGAPPHRGGTLRDPLDTAFRLPALCRIVRVSPRTSLQQNVHYKAVSGGILFARNLVRHRVNEPSPYAFLRAEAVFSRSLEILTSRSSASAGVAGDTKEHHLILNFYTYRSPFGLDDKPAIEESIRWRS